MQEHSVLEDATNLLAYEQHERRVEEAKFLIEYKQQALLEIQWAESRLANLEKGAEPVKSYVNTAGDRAFRFIDHTARL